MHVRKGGNGERKAKTSHFDAHTQAYADWIFELLLWKQRRLGLHLLDLFDTLEQLRKPGERRILFFVLFD